MSDLQDLKPKTRGRPSKDLTQKARAVTIYLTADEIVKLDLLTKMEKSNRSRTIGSLLLNQKIDYSCQDGATTSKGRLEGAKKTRLKAYQKKQDQIQIPEKTLAPVYIVKGLQHKASWIVSASMLNVYPKEYGIYQDVWAISEKTLCRLGPLLKNTKVYREPYEAAEGLELNTSHLGKILDQRINSGDLTVNELDLKAVEDCAKLMEQIIKERLENNLSLF